MLTRHLHLVPTALIYSEFYNNIGGLGVFQYNETDAKVMIEDVTAKNNEGGMYLTGTGITVKNAIITNNFGGLGIGSDVENEITLDGDIDATNNKYGFVVVPARQGTVYVTGDVNLNRNELAGVAAFTQDLTIAVGGSYSGKSGKSGSGSLTACDNNLYDIENDGPSTFEGSDYTCDTTDGTDLPVCKPCHPGCPSPSPSPSESAEFSETQQMIASSMTEDLDLMAMAMDMEYPV
jgi:hypothetical protein